MDVHYGLEQSLAPTVEPLTSAETKLHLRVEITEDDALIGNLIKAARQYAEEYTRRQLITATWKLYLDEFPDVITLFRPPLQTTGTSIQYVDDNGITQTLAASVYQIDTTSVLPRIRPAYGQSWPSTRPIMNAVITTYKNGYGDAATSVPEPIRQALRLLVGHWYENRESVSGVRLEIVPHAVELLLWPYRVLEGD